MQQVSSNLKPHIFLIILRISIMAEQQLHIILFPYMAAGHIIPAIDMAKLFSSSGNVKITIVITSSFASLIATSLNDSISCQVIEFPAPEAGLPQGCDSIDKIMKYPELQSKFLIAMEMMQQPLEKILQELAPDCLVADMFFPWATNAAAKFGIPRLIFHGTSYFALCASLIVRRDKPFKNVLCDSEYFVVPNLPHEITITSLQLSDTDRGEIESVMSKLMTKVRESEVTCYGVIVNSFLELEPEYAEYYKKVFGRRAWQIGPLLLWNREGRKLVAPVNNNDECLRWLDDGKKSNSVIYLCFGSMSEFAPSQLQEIAFGLESSGQQFIWVVRKDDGECLPEGFEERISKANRGLIIRAWAPQVMILEHEAIGAFVTHCGWNSILEGISAGVPLVTWPLFAEQFYNEKLVTQILGNGIPVGSSRWSRIGSGVNREEISNALKCIMEGHKVVEMRNKAKELKDMAWQAIQKDGSSCNDLNVFLKEMRNVKKIN